MKVFEDRNLFKVLDQLKYFVDLRELLEELGLDRIEDRGNEIFARCPYHDDRNPSWSINNDAESERWGLHSCFVCKDEGGKGNLVQLVGMAKGLAYKEAARWLVDRAGIDLSKVAFDASLKRRTVKKRASKKSDVWSQFSEFNILEEGSQGWQYLIERGLTRDQIIACKVKEGSGDFEDRVVFPIFAGLDLVSFYGRHIAGGRPKGKNAKGKGVISGVLYGMDRADPLVDTCYVIEGIFDKLAIDRCSVPNAFATFSNVITPEQAKLLRGWGNIVLVPDQKGGGESLWPSAEKNLYGKNLMVVDLPKGEDADSVDSSILLSKLLQPRKLRKTEVRVFVNYSV